MKMVATIVTVINMRIAVVSPNKTFSSRGDFAHYANYKVFVIKKMQWIICVNEFLDRYSENKEKLDQLAQLI